MKIRTMMDYCGRSLLLARDTSIIKRGLMYAFIVGPILTIINHGDEIISGTMPKGCILKIVLTFIVPYLVSTFSSVSALLREHKGNNARLSKDI